MSGHDWISRVLMRNAVNEATRRPFAPCQARTHVVLGVDPPTVLQCGQTAGHDGLHRFRVEWVGRFVAAASPTEPPTPPKDGEAK